MSDPAASAPHFEVRRGAPTPEELAALIAVVGDAYGSEQAGETATPVTRSRWELSARGLREPLRRERGWGGFGG